MIRPRPVSRQSAPSQDGGGKATGKAGSWSSGAASASKGASGKGASGKGAAAAAAGKWEAAPGKGKAGVGKGAAAAGKGAAPWSAAAGKDGGSKSTPPWSSAGKGESKLPPWSSGAGKGESKPPPWSSGAGSEATTWNSSSSWGSSKGSSSKGSASGGKGGAGQSYSSKGGGGGSAGQTAIGMRKGAAAAAKGGAKGGKSTTAPGAASGNAASGGPAAGKGGQAAQKPTPAPVGQTTSSQIVTVGTSTGASDLTVQTLVGEYHEKGTNHGRKYYQKKPKADESVFLYYWDNRDGDDYSGWWFGDSVGGSQVWAQCQSSSMTPPMLKWKVPWDSAPKPGVLTISFKASPPSAAGTAAVRSASAPATASSAAPKAGPIDWNAKLKSVIDQVAAAEKEAKEAIDGAKSALANGGDVTTIKTGLQQAQERITGVQTALAADAKAAKAAGAAGQGVVNTLLRSSPKLRASLAAIAAELNKVKAPTPPAGAPPTTALAQTAAKHPTPPLKKPTPPSEPPKITEAMVKSAKNAVTALQKRIAVVAKEVESVGVKASAVLQNPPDDVTSAAATAAIGKVEEAASKAQDSIANVKNAVQKQVTSIAGAAEYKDLRTECASLYKTLSEIQAKLNPNKNMKALLQQKTAARKAVEQITEKIDSAEAELLGAIGAAPSPSAEQMSEDDMKAAEAVFTPAKKSVDGASFMLENKLKFASGLIKDDLVKLKERMAEIISKAEDLGKSLSRQRKGLELEKSLQVCQGRVDTAEEAMSNYEKAEAPFLVGGEEVPDMAKATTAVEQAHKRAEAAIQQARAIVKKQQAEAKMAAESVAKAALERLAGFTDRLDAAAKKMSEVSLATFEKKYADVLGPAFSALQACEGKVREFVDATAPFASSALDMPLEELRSASTACAQTDKAAAAAIIEAKKAMAEKAREKKQSGGLAGALAQLQLRLTNSQQEIAKGKKTIASAEKLLKSREACEGNEEKLENVKRGIEKLELILEAGGKLTDEDAAEVVIITDDAEKVFKVVSESLTKNSPLVPPEMKSKMSDLEALVKKLQQRVKDILGKTESDRSRVRCELLIKDAEAHADKVESAFNDAECAEGPYLSGMEELPADDARGVLEACEAAKKEVDQLIFAARTFIKARTLDLKTLKGGNVDGVKQTLEKSNERTEEIAKKLVKYKADLEKRKKNVAMQDTKAAVGAAEEKATALKEEVKPLEAKKSSAKTPEGESSESNVAEPEEEVQATCDRLAAADKAAQAKLVEARALLSKWNAKDTEYGKDVVELQKRLRAVEVAVAAGRKTVNEYEQGFVAEKLRAHASDLLTKAAEEVSKLTEACAPLIENGGDQFLVAVSARTLAEALRAHMKAENLDIAGVFQKIPKGANGRVGEEAFVAWLVGLFEELKKDEIDFEPTRRKELFRHLASDADAGLTLEDFEKLFKRQFKCCSRVTVTDGLSIAKSKTVTKVEEGDELEAQGEDETDGANGMVRVQVKLMSGKDAGKTGWVSVKGNQGTKYLQMDSPFSKCVAEVEVAIKASEKVGNELLRSIRAKTAEIPVAATGPLKETRVELLKATQTITSEIGKITAFKQKVNVAKAGFSKKEEAEKRAHLDRKDRIAVDEALADCRAKSQVLDDAMSKLKDASTPLKGLKDAELEAFETPLTVLKTCEELQVSVVESAKETRLAAKEQQGKVVAQLRGPWADAKKELMQMLAKADGAEKGAVLVVKTTRDTCSKLARQRRPAVRDALRASAQERNITPEALFDELAKGGHRITSDAFAAHLSSLSGLDMKEQHAGLVCEDIQQGGISRRVFVSLFQRYLKVMREIAITDTFELTNAKTLRKAEASEIVQLLEGPKSDEKMGLSRIRGRLVKDGLEGWISVSGNKGTPFMSDCEKPYYAFSKDVDLHTECDAQEVAVVRQAKAGEIFELLEGPRKLEAKPVVRGKVKALKDGAVGFLTVKDGTGAEFAQVANFHACMSVVAITDDLDIKTGKVLRKLAVGEVFEVTEGPVESGDSGIQRVKAKALKDGKEGWVTPKGNAGSIYTKEVQKYYRVVQASSLEKLPTGGEQARILEEGEVVEMVTPLAQPKGEVLTRLKVRALGDSAEGWFSLKADIARPCVPYFKCTREVPLREAKEGTASEIRNATKGEILELVDGPEEGPNGAVWARLRAEKDGASGWAPVREAKEMPCFHVLATSAEAR